MRGLDNNGYDGTRPCRRRRSSASPHAATSHAAWRGAGCPVAPTTLHPSSLPGSPDGVTHLPDVSQTVGATQSVTEVQTLRQPAMLSHLYGAQSFFMPFSFVVVWSPSQVATPGAVFGSQLPFGSQYAPATQAVSEAQEAGQIPLTPSHV